MVLAPKLFQTHRLPRGVPLFTLLLMLAGCTFECGGKALETVPSSAVCDGVIDCWGGQDERTDGCAAELAFCDQPEPEAILAEQVCEGVEDCSDGADEAACEEGG